MQRLTGWYTFFFLAIGTLLASSPPGWGQAGSISEQTPSGAEVPLLEGITVHRYQVTTDSPLAQRYFDQGLNLSYAFNHDEAIRSFEQAIQFDPDCVMAWWGIALCNGPHINNPLMDQPRSQAAWQAIEKAKAACDSATATEQALITALKSRYTADAKANVEERPMFDKRYAMSMRRVHQQFPDNDDVTVLYAESLMDLRPWDLWSPDGQPRPETPTILSLLETVLQRNPNHPGANHLYIHAVEASNEPQRAMAAADRLRTLMPGSGHMVHMPAHIDVRTGKWAQASDQNEHSMRVDQEYRKASPKQGFYSVYMLHNPHFLAFTCMMEGRRERAEQAAKQMLAGITPELLQHSAPLADPFMAIEYQVLVRFGQWDAVLKMPEPPAGLPLTTALWRFARATALAAKRDIPVAEAEQKLFRAAVAAVPNETMGAINKAEDILKVAEHVLAGELAFQKGDIETAIAQLQQGVAAESALLYMEPPEWIQPVRHSLGAVLVAAEKWQQAEQVYRADLVQWPENGWALYGLAQCLKAQHDEAGAADALKRFRAAWGRADTQIGATCLCVLEP
ncbi:tetratricopeptide repeat protein [Roseimaritima ulvae]|uniref:Tetratricopeptide repeat protein n=1 Tax=Roseimaritima ulvae TaxID=980254 RepID=A0A5B9R4V4_9BACT|nr:tetratricopeptide repeat protein [Roseimaritima ulvae]QEG41511.1 Tetratricopeptide repeat protein [Roseimaritima ulvae]